MRGCYRCGAPIEWPLDGLLRVPVCDECANAREARRAARERASRLKWAQRITGASDLTDARKRADKWKGNTRD